MKKIIISLFVSILFFSSCYQAMSGSPATVSACASIGGVIGSIIGDHADGWCGSQFGALIGTVAGAAIGNTMTTPKPENSACYNDDIYSDSQDCVKNVSNIEIRNIRFIDDNRNHTIEADESAKLVFDIVNAGNSPSYNIIPIVEELNENKHLTFSPPQQISYLPKGDEVRYAMTIRADKRLKNGRARFRLYTTESNGAISDVHEFSLPLRKK